MRDQDVTVERTVFDVPKMDCPSEERLVRMALEGAAVQRLDFDLDQRRVTVFHKTSPERLLQLLKPLKFGAQIAASAAGERGQSRGIGVTVEVAASGFAGFIVIGECLPRPHTRNFHRLVPSHRHHRWPSGHDRGRCRR
jgi:hypothetical protein